MPNEQINIPKIDIIRIADVEKRVGYKRCYIYRLIRQGLFPERIRIGVRAVGWSTQEIDQWISQCVQNRKK